MIINKQKKEQVSCDFYTRCNGLIGKILNTQDQISGYLTSGVINNYVFISECYYSDVYKGCKNKIEIDNLKFISYSKITHFLNVDVDKFIRKFIILNDNNCVFDDINDEIIKYQKQIDNGILEHNNTIKNIKQLIKIKTFLIRVKNYYKANDIKGYVILCPKGI